MANYFAAGPPVCDNFLPDMFSPVKCRCVGTCDTRTDPETEDVPPNLLSSYDSALTPYNYDYVSDTWTGPGMVGCHSACVQLESCKFFTFSSESSLNVDGYTSKKHVCRLWKSCDSFQIPANTTFSFRQPETVSVHWSGPRKCDQQYSCPLLPEDSDSYKVYISMVSNSRIKRF